jgi:hypothetical protein
MSGVLPIASMTSLLKIMSLKIAVWCLIAERP